MAVFKRIAHWIMTTAKTGKAAANVDGETIDKLLQKKFQKTGEDWNISVSDCQRTFSHVRFLFTDEVSMMNFNDLGRLSYCDALGKCTSCTTATKCGGGESCKFENEPFGGCVHLAMIGDYAQLPTVKGKPMYYPLSKLSISKHSKIGSIIYNSNHCTTI